MQGRTRRFPSVTLSIAGLALALQATPTAFQDLLIYDRQAVLRGEFWRLWSGHLVHFSAGHLGWNLLVVGLAGTWIERAAFRGSGWFALFAPPAISVALLIGDPALRFYGGLSGLATAAVAFACASEWRLGTSPRALWLAALVGIGMKIAWEYHSGSSMFSRYTGADVRTVPLAHFSGACLGLAFGLFGGGKRAGLPDETPDEMAPR